MAAVPTVEVCYVYNLKPSYQKSVFCSMEMNYDIGMCILQSGLKSRVTFLYIGSTLSHSSAFTLTVASIVVPPCSVADTPTLRRSMLPQYSRLISWFVSTVGMKAACSSETSMYPYKTMSRRQPSTAVKTWSLTQYLLLLSCNESVPSFYTLHMKRKGWARLARSFGINARLISTDW